MDSQNKTSLRCSVAVLQFMKKQSVYKNMCLYTYIYKYI